MAKRKISQGRIVAAFGVAIMADLIQFPVTAATATAVLALPGEFADFMIDCFVMVITSALLGFHWLLLPSLFIEVIPGLDLLPTWTGCVALVVRQRRKEQAETPAALPTKNVQGVVFNPTAPFSLPELPPPPTPASLPPHLPSPCEVAEKRLKHLKDLLDKNLISQAEYEAKRQQILGEI